MIETSADIDEAMTKRSFLIPLGLGLTKPRAPRSVRLNALYHLDADCERFGLPNQVGFGAKAYNWVKRKILALEEQERFAALLEQRR